MQYELTAIVVYQVATLWISTQPSLFTSLAMMILLAVSNSLPMTVCHHSPVTRGSSTILNQLGAKSIMVRAMKSTSKLSLPLRVNGPMSLTHKHSHRVLMTILGGRCLYLISVSCWFGRSCAGPCY